MEDRPFDEVLDAARLGCEWALVVLYRSSHHRILRYLRGRGAAEPEDLAAEVWLDVAAGLGRFHGGAEDFRRWVFAIVRRRLVDQRRRSIRQRTDPTAPSLLPDVLEPGDVEREAMTNLSTEGALARIGALPAAQAEVVLLRVLGDLSVDQVASIVGRRPGAVRALQHRALARLARDLAREAVTWEAPEAMKRVR